MNSKISLICTVYNEEKTISALLESIKNQIRIPDEVVMVDAGSIDKTSSIIREFANKLPIKLIISPGANIATGRNVAIKNTRYDIIASIDGGCTADENWLQNIIKPIESGNTDVVSGVYSPLIETEFEEIVSYMIFPNNEKLDSNFNPSSRSIAYTKNAWAAVGGYPEWLMTAEDTLFDLNLRKSGFRISLAKDAIVFWRIRENRKKLFKQYFGYAKGDGMELLSLKSYSVRYIGFIIALVSVGLFWSNPYFWLFAIPISFSGICLKHVRKVKKLTTKRIFTALTVALTIESAVFAGYVKGNFQRFLKSNSNKKPS